MTRHRAGRGRWPGAAGRDRGRRRRHPRGGDGGHRRGRRRHRDGHPDLAVGDPGRALAIRDHGAVAEGRRPVGRAWAPSLVEPTLTGKEALDATTQRPRRGDILGSGDEPLVTLRSVMRIGIDKTKVPAADAEESARALAELLDIDPKAYAKAVTQAGPKAFVEALVLRDEDASEVSQAAVEAIPGAVGLAGELPARPHPRLRHGDPRPRRPGDRRDRRGLRRPGPPRRPGGPVGPPGPLRRAVWAGPRHRGRGGPGRAGAAALQAPRRPTASRCARRSTPSSRRPRRPPSTASARRAPSSRCARPRARSWRPPTGPAPTGTAPRPSGSTPRARRSRSSRRSR